MTIIPFVFVQDLMWLALVLVGRHFAPTRLTRRLLTVMACYVVLETLAHWYMEAGVALIIRRVL